MNPRARLLSLLSSLTEPHRRRGAETLMLKGRVGIWDRMVSAAYFQVAAGEWAHRARQPGYVDGLHRGLDLCCVGPMRVLDVGTGAGASAAALARRYPSAAITAVDTSRRMLSRARRNFSAPNLEFVLASTTRLPFPDGHFDLVVWMNALPYPEEVSRVASRQAELLGVSTFFSPCGNASSWSRRWREVGFERVVRRDLDDGGIELFRRAA